MALVSAANVVFSVGDRRLLDGVNLTVDEGDRVGLVGANGCGKSTLLGLIANRAGPKPDSGQIQVARGTSIGYLTQEPILDPNRTLRDEAATAFAQLHRLHGQLDTLSHEMASAPEDQVDRLLKRYEQLETQIQAAGGYAIDHQIDATLHGLGLTDDLFGVQVKNLSGGQKGRLGLAKLLLLGPDILLLDEPTNHLDIPGRQWLEQYLVAARHAVILVSHDRWMLDRVVGRICELEQGQLVEYPGNYQAFREQRVQRRIAQHRQYDKQQGKIRQEEQFIARYRAGQRAAQAQGRAKRLERFKQDNLIEQPVDFDQIQIQIRPTTRCGDLVVTADAVSKAYGDRVLFRAFNVVVKRGDRIGIIGPNGSGKSTLVKTLLGQLAPDSGSVRVGNAVQVGHYHQTHEGLDLSLTVVEYLCQFVPSGTQQDARDLAGAFLFSGHDQEKPLGVLSGGERSRVVLAGLVVAGHNVLVLDEPTNHLDISSCEQLEAALQRFAAVPKGFGQKTSGGGTLILVTHDRMLLENLVDQLIVLDGHGNAQHTPCTYSRYIQTCQSQDPGAAPKPSSKSNPRSTPAASKKKPKKPDRPGPPARLSKLSQEDLERRIVELEAQLAQTDARLADPQTYQDGPKVKQLQDQRTVLTGQLTPLEQEWARRAEAH